MSKRLQIYLSPEAEEKLQKVLDEAVIGFTAGTIKISDVVSEMILASDLDIKELRLKYTDFKKSLIELAHTDNLDLEVAIKALQELKSKITKIKSKSSRMNEADNE